MTTQAESAHALDPKNFIPLKVIEKEQLTHDTYRLRFELPDGKTSGMFTASCLVTKANLPGEKNPVIRPYTPTSAPDAAGYMDLVVKGYAKGKMSKHIAELEVGDSLDIKGPIPKIKYEPNKWKHVGMVAGGTGITPMLQVIEEGLRNPEDKTTFALVYGSLSEKDIILREHIEKLAAESKGRFRVHFLINPGQKWSYGNRPTAGVLRSVGFPTKDVLESFLPRAGPDNMVFVCGPPGLMAAVSGNKAPDYTQGEVSGALAELGFTKANVFKF